MPTVLLRKDDTENVSQSYVVGEHILGRGNKLQCSSKKVSRNHGVLNVTNNGVFLKSTHNNPCFYKTQLSESISMLTFGNTIKINNNDKIALALDHGWFIVLVKDNDENTDENQPNTSSANDTTVEDANETVITEILKRAIEANADEETPTKKAKSEENLPSEVVVKSEPLDEGPSTSSSNNNSTNLTVKQEPTIEVDLETVKTEPISNSEDSTTNEDCKKEEDTKECKKENVDETRECKKENDESKNDKPSTSGTDKKPWRDRCWYGSACYRKNGAHRVQFKHPGDADFDSDADDTRPICCYGADCYRKNQDHRKRYRHPGQTKLGAKPPPPPPKRVLDFLDFYDDESDDDSDYERRVRPVRPPPNQMSQDSEELDDYDLNDPFIDDGSEDEYEPSQNTDTESEYEDSQEAAEDHRRLLKEARKFTLNRK